MWTLTIACVIGTKCVLTVPWQGKRLYETEEICQWSGEMILNFIPIERSRFTITCRR